MAPARDFYEILGVSRTATQDEVQRAYRKLARAHHPDQENVSRHDRIGPPGKCRIRVKHAAILAKPWLRGRKAAKKDGRRSLRPSGTETVQRTLKESLTTRGVTKISNSRLSLRFRS